jgi:Ca2+/H+ antiporter
MVYPTDGPDGDGEVWKMTAEPEFERTNRPAAEPEASENEEALVREVQLAFAPIHKRAFGTAIGVAFAVLVAAVTLFHVIADAESASLLRLLDQYFYGYTVSLTGVFIGAFWGFVAGFTGGWFVAFCRNLAIAISVFVTRTRAELSETRDFLDHI